MSWYSRGKPICIDWFGPMLENKADTCGVKLYVQYGRISVVLDFVDRLPYYPYSFTNPIQQFNTNNIYYVW
jgi:hypothetical protein